MHLQLGGRRASTRRRPVREQPLPCHGTIGSVRPVEKASQRPTAGSAGAEGPGPSPRGRREACLAVHPIQDWSCTCAHLHQRGEGPRWPQQLDVAGDPLSKSAPVGPAPVHQQLLQMAERVAVGARVAISKTLFFSPLFCNTKQFTIKITL